MRMSTSKPLIVFFCAVLVTALASFNNAFASQSTTPENNPSFFQENGCDAMAGDCRWQQNKYWVFHCKEQLGDFPLKGGRAETLLIDRHRALVPFNDDGKLSYKFLPVVGIDRMRIGDFAMLEPSRGRARFQGSSFWFQCNQKRQTWLSTF